MQRQGPQEASLRRKEKGPARLACFPGHRWKGARLLGRASPRVLCPDSGRGGPEPGEEPAVTRTEPSTWETEGAASHHARPEPQHPQNVGAAGGPGHRAPLLTARLGRGGRPGPELEARQNHLLRLPSQRGAQGAASVRLLSLHGWLQPTQGRERSETGCVHCRALVRGGRGERVCMGERACVCARFFPKTGCLAPARPSAAGRPVHSCG